jgi:hypothetical protein
MNEQPNKKLFKGSFFIFQNNFSQKLFPISFDLRKKNWEKMKIQFRVENFPTLKYLLGKRKWKIWKTCSISHAVWDRVVFWIDDRNSFFNFYFF